ncbi:MAG: carboxypeptidase-like regulatory domain-containing protein [Patescibacteria group bacterium UBA2103]
MKKMYTRGLSLVDVVVGVALLLVIFMALFGMFRASIALVAHSKARAGATALATEQMEYVRSVTYANTGTVGGIPAGVVEPEIDRVLNGRDYTVRTFIQYIDDPADGLDGADATGIITDYKKIKVEVSYTVAGQQESVSLVSNRTPKGIETTEGGGNLRVNVIDAVGSPVSSAQVRIQNPNTSPVVDLTTFTGSGGYVFLPGAATSTGYRVTISKTGYSSAQTYDLDSENVIPDPGHLTVVEAETTQNTFAIDVLSSLRVNTWSPIEENYVEDTFVNGSKIESASSTEVTGGNLVLTSTEGVYDAAGVAQSTSTAPTYLSSWKFFQATSTLPAGTSVSYQFFYDVAGSPIMIPDVDLPGNASGFSASVVDLSSLATTTYDTIYVEASLETNDTSTTPEIDAWRIVFDEGPIPIPNVSFNLLGSKTIGEDSGGDPIVKHDIDAATGSAGWNEVLNIEWDAYAFSVSGYDIAAICDTDDLSINPNTAGEIDVYLEDASTHSLRVEVRDDFNALIEGATLSLTRTGYSEQDVTSSCGQGYFGSLGNFADYDLSVSKSGYTTELVQDVDVDGDTAVSVVLIAS